MEPEHQRVGGCRVDERQRVSTDDTPRDPHDQMRLDEVMDGDSALAFALQTHLCYSSIQPGDLPFRVLRKRLALTGFTLDATRPSGDEALRAAAQAVVAQLDWFEDEHAPGRVSVVAYEALRAALATPSSAPAGIVEDSRPPRPDVEGLPASAEKVGEAIHAAVHPGHPWSGCNNPDLVYAWDARFRAALRDSRS